MSNDAPFLRRLDAELLSSALAWIVISEQFNYGRGKVEQQQALVMACIVMIEKANHARFGVRIDVLLPASAPHQLGALSSLLSTLLLQQKARNGWMDVQKVERNNETERNALRYYLAL